MQRHELERIIKEEGYKPGGTKEACAKIREVLNYKMNPGNQLHAPESCVDIEEFLQSVSVLIAAVQTLPDMKVTDKLYHCESDCAYIHRGLCPGELNVGISNLGNVLCPYYCIEDK